MDVLNAIKERRSIRKFTRVKIAPETTGILQEILLRSPSAKNGCPWEFIFVDDPGTIDRLKNSKSYGTRPLETSPLAVAVCADETTTDTWVEDCSIAGAMLQVAAHSLGLGTCWVHIRNRVNTENRSSEELVREILQIPGNYRVLCLIAIGIPDEKKEPKKQEALHFEKIRLNRF